MGVLIYILLMLRLTIATYNVNGLRDSTKCSKVIQWGKTFDVDIFLLQETFLHSPKDYDAFKSKWGGPVFFSPSLSHLSGGVAIAFNARHNWSISQVKRDSIGRCLSLLCTIHDISFRICNVHAPCHTSERKEYLDNVISFVNGNYPLILAGDFNCVMENIDSSSVSANFTGRAEINDLISLYNLIDVYRSFHPLHAGHTWFRKNHNQSSRIDRIYIPNNFSITDVSTPCLPFSDHNPVYACIYPSAASKRGRGYWKYNATLNSNESFCREFRLHYRMWSSLKPGFGSLLEWWDNIKGKIKSLAIRHSVRLAKEKRDRLKDLQILCSNSAGDEINLFLDNELRGAFIRSRAKFLEEGEKPSAFFFKKERKCGQKRLIQGIRNVVGKEVNSEDGIFKVFHQFYSSLFSDDGLTDSSTQDYFINSLSSQISQQQQVSMDLPITLAEVKEALFSVSKNKSPGFDGLPYEFYSTFFDILGTDLVDVFNECFSKGSLTPSQAIGVITLLPKKGDLLDPGNWRPISLLNSDYKLIAKVLQIRLSKVLPAIVNSFQACAVPGRSIHSNLLIVRDVIDYCGLKDDGCALISIDQHKAFDKVNWRFLMKVLKKLNFGANFRKWISILYNNICSRLLINGKLSDPVCIARGVRQGCPLSPLLYVLFVEPIARYIERCNQIRGFRIPSNEGCNIKFLQYADDATCVATSVDEINHFLEVFSMFEKATGASININKSFGLKLGRFKNLDIPVDIAWSNEEIKITGVTFGSDKAVHSNWELKLRKANSKLQLWKNRHLTLLGKVVVINTAIYPLFYFTAPVFPIPSDCEKELKKAVYTFLWGENKPELVTRDVVTLEKGNGGLGLDNFRLKLDALLIKPLFPLFSDQDPPTHLLLSRYFIASNLRSVYPSIWSNSRPNSSVCTNSLIRACSTIKQVCLTDYNFSISCKKTKDIVKMLSHENIEIHSVKKHPSLPWDTIWKRVFNTILDNKLCDFQWRLAHRVLNTGERIAKWGLSDGKCPFPHCNEVESFLHLFWNCSRIIPILRWTKTVFFSLIGSNYSFSDSLFLYGYHGIDVPDIVFDRLWFVFCITKFVIWKSRCVFVFQDVNQTVDVMRSTIVKEIKDRVWADRCRFSRRKFYKVWLKGNSFVKCVNENLIFTL